MGSLRDVLLEDIFKLSASTSEFCESVQVGIDVYILNCKYQVKPHSPPSFSAACAAGIVQRNHFLCLHQQNKSSESKIKFRQASNHCKRVLNAAKLAYATKTKESITSQKLGSQKLLIVLSTKVNLLYLLYSVAQRCCRLHLIKQNWLVKIFPRILIL